MLYITYVERNKMGRPPLSGIESYLPLAYMSAVFLNKE